MTLSFVYSASLPAQNDRVEDNEEIIALIKSVLQHFPAGTEFSVGKINQNELTFCGFRKTKESIVAAQNQDHVFEIGSITKVYTSYLLAQLSSESKIQLDQPTTTFIPYMLQTDTLITLRHLASHTSGLPRMPTNFMRENTNPLSPFLAYDGEALDQYLTLEMVLDNSPGSKYGYSNLGMGLLGFIIEKIEHKQLAEIFQDRIFEPLNMHSSSLSRHDIDAHRVEGQTAMGQKTHPWDFDVLAGAGAIVSSVRDQIKFMADQLREENPFIAIMTDSLVSVSEDMSVGLGWHLRSIDDIGPYLWHNGGTSGYTSSLSIDRGTKTGIVILSNVSAFHPKMGKIDELNFALMKMMEE